MKDIYKNPILYYAVVPVIIALWPLMVAAVYLPRVEKQLGEDKLKYDDAGEIIKNIATLDPGRLEFSNSTTKTGEFDYATVVNKIAGSCGISEGNYELSTKPVRTSKGQKTQNCHITLKDVKITAFAEFLSAIQMRWSNLQCESVTLVKKKGLPDTWKIDMDLKYYF